MSVLISQDGLSFYTYSDNYIVEHWDVVFDGKLNPVQILQKIEKEYESRQELKQQFKNVNLIYHHDIFSLAPRPIFKADHASDYLKYNARLLKTDILSHDFVNEEVVIYIAFENINNYFYEKYGTFDYFHYASKILEQRYLKVETEDTFIFIEKINDQFYLTLFKQKKLIAHNLFLCETNEDLLYYLMFSVQQHDLDPTEVKLKIISPSNEGALVELLEMYILQVEVQEEYQDYKQQLLCV